MATYYKVLVDGRSCHGGDLVWSLPTQLDDGTWEPGDWHEVDGDIRICTNGLHLTDQPWERWPKIGATVWEAEIHPDAARATHEDKIAVSKCRLVGPGPEAPEWWRRVERFVTEEIPAVRWFANHEDPLPEWRVFDTLDAARDAAWDAAWGAAWDAAWNAAWDAARDAAWDAARGAARGAAWDAARGAAWDAARGAARDAAWDAAWDADLMASMLCVSDLDIDAKHVQHAKDRWEVWRRGYGLLCDIDGALYVYGKVST